MQKNKQKNKEDNKEIKQNIQSLINRKYFPIVVILIVTAFVCIPLLNSKLDMTYDDGIQHIARIIGTFQGMHTGNTAVFENFCNGFGYAWNLFYSPITAFAPLIFKIIGVSFAVCIKLFMFLVVFLSGYFMYMFVKKLTKNNYIAIISAVLYILAPYRITDMYIRNALGELTSFVFIPIVFLGLYNLFNEEESKKIYIPLILGSAGLFLTHAVITMYTAIFALVYVIINIVKERKALSVNITKRNRIIKVLIISTVLILLICAYFWMPLLQLKNSTEYEVFQPGRMERTEVLVAYKLDFYRLFFTLKNDYMIYEIGIITLIGLALTPIAIKKIKQEKYYRTYLFVLLMGIISCIMTLRIFPFEHLPATLKMLQFSFRMLEFSSFAFSFIAAINIVTACKKFEFKELFILIIAVMVLTIPFLTQVRTIENYDEQRLIDTVPVTSRTGRVHAGCASFEYLPTKAFENRDYIETRSQDAIVLSNNAEVENQLKENSKMSFDIKYIHNDNEDNKDNKDNEENIDNEEQTDTQEQKEIEIELPYIYYPGYSATIKHDGQKETIETYESEKGFASIKVQAVEEGTINVEYTGTSIMNISKTISIAGICLFLIVINEDKLKNKTAIKKNLDN